MIFGLNSNYALYSRFISLDSLLLCFNYDFVQYSAMVFIVKRVTTCIFGASNGFMELKFISICNIDLVQG